MNTCCHFKRSRRAALGILAILAGSLLSALCFSFLALQPAVAHGKPKPRLLIIPISKYGAVGDGNTDDTAAIKAAIKAGGHSAILTAGQGTYCYSAALTFPSGVSFEGTGKGATVANVILKPTADGAALIFQGLSGLSNCTVGRQPSDVGWNYPAIDPTPTEREIYATKGASLTLNNVGLPVSTVCIDCDSINIQNCSGVSDVIIYGSRNITLKNDTLTDYYNIWGSLGYIIGTCSMYPDSAGVVATGVNITSCTLGGLYGYIGGGAVSNSTQGVENCNFLSYQPAIIIANNGARVYSNFNFTGNTITGNSTNSQGIGSVSNFLNYNVRVRVVVSHNQFHSPVVFDSASGNAIPEASVTLGSFGQTQASIGKIDFSYNDVWAPVFCAGGEGLYTGGLTITNNTFSQVGSITWSSDAPQWAGPLTISNNTFTITTGSSATYFTAVSCPLLVELPAVNVKNIASLITIENNICTSPAAIPGFIIVLAPTTYTTKISGNTITPTGAITQVVNTLSAFQTLWAQLYPPPTTGG